MSGPHRIIGEAKHPLLLAFSTAKDEIRVWLPAFEADVGFKIEVVKTNPLPIDHAGG